jgi:hypothetical protein
MSTTITKRVERLKVLSTKVTEKDSRFLQAMVNRYFEHGIIPQPMNVKTMNKILVPITSKKLINCIRPQKVILVFLTLIYSKRQITLQSHQLQTVLLQDDADNFT